jgi:hypothetical protein
MSRKKCKSRYTGNKAIYLYWRRRDDALENTVGGEDRVVLVRLWDDTGAERVGDFEE